MSERRPHWDDELIFAVMSAAGDGGHLFIDDIHAVIAAVEDWHEKFVMHGAFRVLAERAASAEADRDRLANQLLNEVPDSYIQMKARALTAEAAIERVRSACNRIIENAQRFDLDDEHGLVYGQWMTAKSILRALDGDA